MIKSDKRKLICDVRRLEMAKNNPYTLVFGKQPIQSIPRPVETQEVMDAFLNEPATQQIYMITGVRGCGKTVFMTEVANKLKEHDGWEVLELSTSQDLLTSMAESLTQENRFTKLFKQGLGVTVAGFGFQFNGKTEVTSPRVLISEALKVLKKHNKKLLICIDEVVSNDYMKEFVSVFQILLREDYPIYLLMTGLYENINDLRNEKNLTFLYRAPEIRMRALNKGAMIENYMSNLSISGDDAEEMAKLTKGYSFAFQVLGYFTFRHENDYRMAVSEYRQYLEEYVYEKIWSELSRGDRNLLYAVAKSKTGKVKEIKEIMGVNNNQYTPYRDRMIKKMLLDGSEYGYLRITLPLFEDYVIRSYTDY